MNKNLRVKTELDRLIEVMTWLLKLNTDDQEKVQILVKQLGINRFFSEIERHDLSQDVKEKLIDLRNVQTAVGDMNAAPDLKEGGKA